MPTSTYYNVQNVTSLADDATGANIQTYGVMIVRATTISVISFLALFGNSLVVAAVLKYRKLKTSANVFVANLAMSNVTTGVLLIFLTWNVVVNRNAMGTNGCRAWGMLAGTTVICSTFTMALVALNRYVLIAHAATYRAIFNPRKCVMMSLIAWLVGVCAMVGTVTGWSEVLYNPRTKACSYARNASIGFHYFVIGVGFGIPLIGVSIFYSLLYYTVLKSKRRITAQNSMKEHLAMQQQKKTHATVIEDDPVSEPDDRRQYKRQAPPKVKEVKLTRMLVTIFLVYVTCLGPYSFVNMVDSDGTRFPEFVHILVTWLLFSNAAINPFIYGFMNKNFRDGYIALLGSQCACAKRILDKARLDTGESTIIVKNSI